MRLYDFPNRKKNNGTEGTAKLMDENETLYKLKELEYLEKICDHVGSISVVGGTDLLSQLTQILKGESL